MTNLGPIDLLILASYFIAILVAGLWMSRRATQSLDHYYLGGRRMPWYLLGISGMTNWFDLTGTMIITSFLYMLGPRGLYIEFRGGAVLCLAFMLLWTGKWHRRSGAMTIAEWYTHRFGTGPSAEFMRLMSAIMGIAGTIGLLAYIVRGTTLFIGFFFPSAPILATAALVGVAALYLMLSGFYGVIMTDLVQGIIIILACLIVSVMAFLVIPNAKAVSEVAQQVTGNPGWLDFSFSNPTSLPADYSAYQSLWLFAGFYALKSCLEGMGSGFESRYFGARSDRDCGLQSLQQGITVAFRWPLMIAFAVLGLFLVRDTFPDKAVVQQSAAIIQSYVPGLTESNWHSTTSQISSQPERYSPEMVSKLEKTLGKDWASSLPLVGFRGEVNPEQVFPAVLCKRLPAGLKGFVLVAMLAAMMSTISGYVNTTSALFVRDIYQNFIRRHAQTRELIWISYAATLAVIVLGFMMGLAAHSINDIWGWIVMGLGAGALGPAVLRLYWWRCNAWGCACGTLLGGLGAIVQRLVAPQMLEWQQFLLMVSLSFGGVIVGSLLTKPAQSDIVRKFYIGTRPFGLWGPYWKELTSEQKASWRFEHRNDIIALPFALLGQVTLFLLLMQLIVHAYGSFFVTLPLFLASAAGLYWFWWRNLK